MRFNQIIHPEILLGRRGSKQDRELMKKMLQHVEGVDPEKGILASPELIALGDINMVDAFAIMKKWKDDPAHSIYHVGGDFLREISKVDRAIPVDRLPDYFFAYISFGKDIIRDEDDPIQGAYIYIGPASGTSFASEKYVSSKNAKALWVVYVTDREHYKTASLRVELSENITMRKLISGVQSMDMMFGEGDIVPDEITNKREVVFRTLVNIVLYIHQPDPELEKLMPHANLIGERKRRQLLHKVELGTAIYNACTLPVTFVNWRWHKPMSAHTVSGHFKWQPHGVGKVLRKLIWLDAYERGEEEGVK